MSASFVFSVCSLFVLEVIFKLTQARSRASGREVTPKVFPKSHRNNGCGSSALLLQRNLFFYLQSIQLFHHLTPLVEKGSRCSIAVSWMKPRRTMCYLYCSHCVNAETETKQRCVVLWHGDECTRSNTAQLGLSPLCVMHLISVCCQSTCWHTLNLNFYTQLRQTWNYPLDNWLVNYIITNLSLLSWKRRNTSFRQHWNSSWQKHQQPNERN